MLAVRLSFTNSTSDTFTVTVPEPAALTWLALTGLPLLRSPRRNT